MMKKNYPPNFTYQDFGRDFTAEFFDPQHWASVLKASGARWEQFWYLEPHSAGQWGTGYHTKNGYKTWEMEIQPLKITEQQ